MVTTLLHVSARHHPAMPALAAWQSGHGAMRARPTRNGGDSTIPRSGRQGPPLPDTDLTQAAGSSSLSNIALEPGSTGYVESLVRSTGRGCGR